MRNEEYVNWRKIEEFRQMTKERGRKIGQLSKKRL
jgi:hypothetical protein